MSDSYPIERRDDPAWDVGIPSRGEFSAPQSHDYEPEEQTGGGFSRYVSALLRFKWLVLAVVLLGSAAGVFLARAVPLMYQAQTTIWIEASQPKGVEPISSGELLSAAAWVELLRSYAVLDPVVRAERLYLSVLSPDSMGATQNMSVPGEVRPGRYRLVVDATGGRYSLLNSEGAVIEGAAVGDSIGRALGLAWVPPSGSLRPKQEIEFNLYDVRAIATSLSRQMQLSADEYVNFLTVSMTGPDPDQLARTLNAIGEQFVTVSADLKRAQLSELSDILREQLDVAGQDLHDAEAALEAFRVNTITLPTDRGSPLAGGVQATQDPVYENFFEMRIEREQLHRDRESIARILSDAETGATSLFALEPVPSLARAPGIKASLAELATLRAELRVLEQRYTPQNNRVIRLRESIAQLENVTIPAQARALLVALDNRDRDLAGLTASASAQLQAIPPRLIEQARLQRRVSIAEEMYRVLQGRYEEARLAALSAVADVRLLDRAGVPQWPTNGAAGSRIMLMVIIGSLGMAVMGAILLDRIDPKVRYPDQVTSGLGLPILGAVPFVRNADRPGTPAEANHAIEAFREVRMNVQHAIGMRGAMALTVSSAEAGDGKSFVTSNLALAFAQQGHRTLVIDGDIRRGRLHRFLRGVRTPGLSDLLAESVGLREVIQQTDVPLVTLIGSGTRMEVGPELLGSAAMSRYLQELKREYDVIIVDTPPLGAGVDPYVLATLTGNLLMVVRTGNTNRAFAEAKLKLVDRLPVRVVGAVLNGITGNQGVYRYYSYLPSYGAREEPQKAEDGGPLVRVG